MKFALISALWLVVMAVPTAFAQPATGIDVNMDAAGHYTIQTHAPELTFAGDLGIPPEAVRATDATDGLGPFHQVAFDYAGRTSSITA